MRLAEFISTEMEAILVEWEVFAAAQLPAATGMQRLALRDHAQRILETVVADIMQPQTDDAQTQKSLGRAPPAMGAAATAAQMHARLRSHSGFDITQMVAEYRALRASVLRQWTGAVSPEPINLQDSIRFNEAIDQAVAESTAAFSHDVDGAQDCAHTLESWFANAPGFVALLHGPQFRFEMVNDAFFQLVGRRDMIGRPAFEALPEVCDQGFQEPLQSVYRSGAPFVGRAMRVMLQREPNDAPVEAFVDFVFQPIFDAQRAVSRIFVQGNDVTERVVSLKALDSAARRKAEFLATLAHELRNPLAPILQSALLAKTSPADSEQHRFALDVINRQARHMAALLEDLQDVSRIAHGRLVLRPKSVCLSDVIHAAVETARPAIDAARHRLTVVMPPREVRWVVDPTRVAQAVSNLLLNAARYTQDEGLIELTAECDGDEVIISVQDNGAGLPADSLAHIFEMQSPAVPALDCDPRPLGVGLALCQRLTQLHGGSIAAHSPGIGLGSRFVIRLPWKRGAPVSTATSQAASKSPASGRRVLLADDNADAMASLGLLLELEGHEVHAVKDGQEALAAAQRLRPDVTVLDIGMPGLNGYEVAAAIRSEAWGGSMLLIALTGWGKTEDHARAKAAGFDHHCTKPVDPELLFRLISPAARIPPDTSQPA